MPTGAAVMPPPPSYLPPPQPLVPPPAYPRRRPGWLAVSVMLALALLLALSATVMSAVKLSQSTPAATTTTITAPPPPPPSYSPDQVAAAKGSLRRKRYRRPINARCSTEFFRRSAGPAIASVPSCPRQFPTGCDAGNAVHATASSPATPKNVLDAINNYITAVIALVDANTRELSDHDAQPFVLAVRNAGDQLDKVCE